MVKPKKIKVNTLTYPAAVTIGRWHNSELGERIRIEIEDRKTGKRIAEVRMSLAQFSECVTGVRDCPATGLKIKRRPTR